MMKPMPDKEKIKQREEDEVFWMAQNLCQLEHEDRQEVIEKLFGELQRNLDRGELLDLYESLYNYITEQDELEEELIERNIINKI